MCTWPLTMVYHGHICPSSHTGETWCILRRFSSRPVTFFVMNNIHMSDRLSIFILVAELPIEWSCPLIRKYMTLDTTSWGDSVSQVDNMKELYLISQNIGNSYKILFVRVFKFVYGNRKSVSHFVNTRFLYMSFDMVCLCQNVHNHVHERYGVL